NAFGVIPGFEDQPVLAETEARFRLEAVAAVVGRAEIVANLPPFPVSYTELPAALIPSEAGAVANLHPGREGNVMCRGHVSRGDAAAALAASAHVVEGHFSTGFIEHGY
ncbi:MAG TPA: aldehyde oxidase, partial [Citreicella sp.]|nr:aldehyde oxidase [Citreicella sp.]